ncbi:MAG: pre-peptidase C-terminal domain-containing protein, partial [Candidatus Thorarchaeota archaeon]
LYCGGTNDFDLYGALDYTPSTLDYMLLGYDIGGEDVTYDNPEEGIWHIMVYSFSGAGPYTLNIDITFA